MTFNVKFYLGRHKQHDLKTCSMLINVTFKITAAISQMGRTDI